MSDITVRHEVAVPENRSWLIGTHGTEPGANPNITIDVSLCEDVIDRGAIWSGTVLGVVTATGLYGPYDPEAEDGRETAKCLLFSTLSVRTGAGRLAGAGFVHGFVNSGRLPIQSGAGSLGADGAADLSAIDFEN